MTKRIFSGAQPTGNVHLGNYPGALKNWVALQHEYESFFCIVSNLLEITGKTQQEVEDHFAGKGYAQLKGDLAEATVEFLPPFQQRVREITDEQLDRILNQSREKAQKIARVTLDHVFQRTGIAVKR